SLLSLLITVVFQSALETHIASQIDTQDCRENCEDLGYKELRPAHRFEQAFPFCLTHDLFQASRFNSRHAASPPKLFRAPPPTLAAENWQTDEGTCRNVSPSLQNFL